MTNELRFEYNATDEEIRAWMDAEIIRLGDLFNGFEITWHQYSDFEYSVDLWSEVKNPSIRLDMPHGRHLIIGKVCDRCGYDPIPILQSEGRKLYYKLKNDYPVKRELWRN